MNKETRNIDKLFGDKLSGLKTPLPAGAWNRMHKDLDVGRKRKAYFIFRLAAASVLLLLAFGAGFYYAGIIESNNELVQSKNKNEQPVILSPEETQSTAVINNEVDNSDVDPTIQTQTFASASETIIEDINEDIKIDQGSDFAYEASVQMKIERNDPDGKISPQQQSLRQPDLLLPLASLQPEGFTTSGFELIVLNEKNKQPVNSGIVDPLWYDYSSETYFNDPPSKSSDNAKWTIGGQVAPIYSFRDISTNYSGSQPSNSVAQEDQLNNAEESLMAYAGGLNVDYRLKGRWSVQSGLYFSRIGQENNDALEFSQDNKQFVLVAIHTSTGDINLELADIPPGIQRVQSPKDSSGVDIGPVKVVQNFDLFEIPFLVKYKFLDKKLALNFTGGLSPAFLLKNATYLEYEGERYNVGDAGNLNNMIVNTSLGMGLEYSFTKQLSFNFQPTFKYALSPINSNTEFSYHPYSFSWFTGISFRF